MTSPISALEADRRVNARRISEAREDDGGDGSCPSQTPFDDHAQFMRACGQTVGDFNLLQAALYAKLIDEEYGELRKALEAGDEVEQADAVIDLIVVLVGYAHSKGWPVNALWREVHRSNMAKVDPVTGQVRRRQDGKILKPDGWMPPDVVGVLRQAERLF